MNNIYFMENNEMALFYELFAKKENTVNKRSYLEFQRLGRYPHSHTAHV